MLGKMHQFYCLTPQSVCRNNGTTGNLYSSLAKVYCLFCNCGVLKPCIEMKGFASSLKQSLWKLSISSTDVPTKKIHIERF